MKRLLRATLLVITLALAGFLFIPLLIRTTYGALSSGADLQSLTQQYRLLDAVESDLPEPQKERSIRRRLAISAWLAMRGVAIDSGIRDEAVEHSSFFPRVYGMTCWEWGDMLDYWRSPSSQKDPQHLRSDLDG